MNRLISTGAFCIAGFLCGCDSTNLETLDSRLLVASNDITSVEVTSPSPVIQVGGSRALNLVGTIDGAETVVTNSALWSSSNSAVLSVSSAGIVTGIADGSAVITASLGPLSNAIELRASSAVLEKIDVVVDPTVTDATIDECTSVGFTATGDYSDGETGRPLTELVAWSLSEGSIGVFDDDMRGLLRSSNAGLGTVLAELDGIDGTFDLTVSDNLESIEITSDGSTLSARNSVQYTATASYLNSDETVDITDNSDWSLVASFAAVDDVLPGKGIVTATSTGTSSLSVECGGVPASFDISSGSATDIQSFFFDPESPSDATFSGLETLQIRAYIRFENGTNREVTEETSWTAVSNNNSQNFIDNRDGSKGIVTIRGPGILEVEASFLDEDNDPPRTFTDQFTVTRRSPP